MLRVDANIRRLYIIPFNTSRVLYETFGNFISTVTRGILLLWYVCCGKNAKIYMEINR